MADQPGGFATTYMVELLCQTKPVVSKRALYDALKRRCPGARPIDGHLDKGLLHFVHEDHLVPFKEGKLPAQTMFMQTDKSTTPERYAKALEQSWGFPLAAAVVPTCRSSVLLMEMMSSPLPHRERIELFQNALAAALEVIPCQAIYWAPTEQIVDPHHYRQSFDEPGCPRFTLGALNVRLFNISGTADDMVMDSLGLAALGLPDLQCHFRGLDCNAIAGLLHNLGIYLFENGDVIEDGHTIDGIAANQRWRCQHEMSLIGPERAVLDIDPGQPFAAGNRNR